MAFRLVIHHILVAWSVLIKRSVDGSTINSTRSLSDNLFSLTSSYKYDTVSHVLTEDLITVEKLLITETPVIVVTPTSVTLTSVTPTSVTPTSVTPTSVTPTSVTRSRESATAVSESTTSRPCINCPDARLPLMLKFHVSGQLDEGYVENQNMPEKLSDLSMMLHEQLTNLFKSEKVFDVQMDSVRRSAPFITFTSTTFFNTDTRMDAASIKQLISESSDFKPSDIYVFEYCVKNTCNDGNGHCEFKDGSAYCLCKAGFIKDRCTSKTYSENDYNVAGVMCGVILSVIFVLLFIFCRTYKFIPEEKQIPNSKASSVTTTKSLGDHFSSGQEVLVKQQNHNGFLTYKNMCTRGSNRATGIDNKAFVIDSSYRRDGDTIYKKQLKKFFEDAPQMRLNNASVSRDNSSSETDKTRTKKTMHGVNSYKSSSEGKANNIK